MYSWIILGLTIVILGIIIWKAPAFLAPLLGAAVALEISITWYPDLGIINSALGLPSLARFVSIALIIAGWGRLLTSAETRQKFSKVIKHPLTLMVLLYIVFGAVSLIYSAAPDRTIVEVIRLFVLFAVYIAIALLMEKEYATMPLRFVHFVALALAPLVFYEGFTGNLIWRSEILQETVLRVNAAFIDPNIFARFIVLAVAANLVLQLFARDANTKMLYFAALPVLLAELMLTASRGGIVTLIVVILAALILLPNKKPVLWLMGLGGLAGIIVLIGAPDVWDRMMQITTNLQESQPHRYALWQGAIAIFQDNMLTGTGLGTFQHVFTTDYAHLRTMAYNEVTISHTTVLTIAAELGVIGLTILGFIWIVLFGVLYQLHGRTDSNINIFKSNTNEYYVGSGYFLWILAIFISSQLEGRLFEDPMLWLSMGMLVILTFYEQFSGRYR